MAKKDQDNGKKGGGGKAPAVNFFSMFTPGKKEGEFNIKPGAVLKPGDIKDTGDLYTIFKKAGFPLNKSGTKLKKGTTGGDMVAPIARFFARLPGVGGPSGLPNAPAGTFGPVGGGSSPGGGGGGGGGGGR